MDKKLNEILKKSEARFEEYKHAHEELNHKLGFLSDHKFPKELEWLIHERDSKADLYYDYRNMIEEVRDLLNKWNS